jgi:hypothetical protein
MLVHYSVHGMVSQAYVLQRHLFILKAITRTCVRKVDVAADRLCNRNGPKSASGVHEGLGGVMGTF